MQRARRGIDRLGDVGDRHVLGQVIEHEALGAPHVIRRGLARRGSDPLVQRRRQGRQQQVFRVRRDVRRVVEQPSGGRFARDVIDHPAQRPMWLGIE